MVNQSDRKLVLTGASGFLGSVVLNKAIGSWQTVGLYLSHPIPPSPRLHTKRLNLTSHRAVRNFLQREKPDVIIHTAAQTRVDACEKDPKGCRELNELGTRFLAEAAAQAGSRFIFISTDLVFDGKRGYYSEEDIPNPLSTYAQTKRAAEKIVLKTCPNAVVARIAILYGKSPQHRYSFSEWLRKSWQMGRPTPLFYDQFRTPIWVENLADALLELAELDFTGIVHLAGLTRIDRLRFAEILAEIVGADKNLLVPRSMFDDQPAAPRPRDVSLKIDRARSILHTPFLSVEEGLTLAYGR